MERGWQKFYMRSSLSLRYDPRYCIYFSNIYIIGVSILEYFILQIVAVTTDNASNNKTMMQILANKLRRYNKFFTASRQVLCFAHIMKLVMQASIKTFNVRPEIQDKVNAFEDTPLTLNVNDFVWTDPENVHNEDDEEGSGRMRTASRQRTIWCLMKTPRSLFTMIPFIPAFRRLRRYIHSSI